MTGRIQGTHAGTGLLWTLFCLLSACGDGSQAPAERIYPRAYVSLSPNLSRYRTFENVRVGIDFDRSIDPETVSARSVYLTEGETGSSAKVAATLSVSGSHVSLVPDQPLRFGVHYRARVTRDVKGADGATYDWVFNGVTFGNTRLPARGDVFVVNIPSNLAEKDLGSGYPFLGYLPPLPSLDPEKTDPDIPEQVPGNAITEAWKLSTGRADVLVAVMDNGLESYAEKSISNNLYLNRCELPLPRDAAGRSICDLRPDCLRGDRFDFNQDGRFNIRDYQAAGYALAKDGSLQPVRHRDGTGAADPEDLFTLFMDGIDGYPADPDTPPCRGTLALADDISGYDFFSDSPRALGMKHFPEGTHGQGRAENVAGQAGVAGQEVGACPGCTVMVCRVTYALLEEGELLGHGIRYALEQGADVIVSVLGALNGTAGEVEAMRLADEAGVPVIVGMSDEGSFHHTFPSVFNHAIATKANIAFFVESPCTMYGGQTHFSAVGQCGSDAGGLSGGAAGLLLSRARELGYCGRSSPGDPACRAPDLSANQVKQILTQTAEKPKKLAACFGIVTDAPCSRHWDWHQGYGRMNLFRALKRLEAGRLPPDVQILDPGWFAVLNRGLPSAGKLGGRVGPPGQTVDRCLCEWAPGIEPDDEAFRSLACALEEGGALRADLPLEDMAAAVGGETRIPDDPQGKAVTVRVRAFSGEAYGEDRRVFAVHRDPTWVQGYPVSLVDRDGDGREEISPAAENSPSIEGSPAMEDLDRDGRDEVILVTSNDQLHVLRYAPGSGPYEADGFPVRVDRPGEYSNNLMAAPAVGDVDLDGYADIVLATFTGRLHAFRGIDGAPLCGPQGVILETDPPSRKSPDAFGAGPMFYGSPVLADLNRDGYLDVVAGCGDQKVYAVDGRSISRGRPERLAGWPVKPADPARCSPQEGISIVGTVAAADLTGDGVPEIITGTSEICQSPVNESGRLYALWPDGNLHPGGPVLPGFPAVIPPNPLLSALDVLIPLPPLSTGVPSSPVAAKQGDEVWIGLASMLGPLTLVQVQVPTGEVRVAPLSLRTFGEAESGAFHRGQDGLLHFAMGACTLGPAGGHGLFRLEHRVDHFLPGVFPGPINLYDSPDYHFFMNPSFADVSGDGRTEVVMASGGHFVQAFDLEKREPDAWPKFTNGWHMASPAFGDMDGDGLLEMVAPVRLGRVFAWHTQGRTSDRHSWMTFHHDNRRTGSLETPFP